MARSLALAALMLLAACGSHPARPAASPQQRTLAELFPASEVSLLRAPVLEVLPRVTLAVVVVPGLQQARERWAPARLDRDIRAALGRAGQQLLGHDLFDLDRLADMGVDTRAPAALALLDPYTAAVVMPLADAGAFARAWQAPVDTELVLGRGHAVIAFGAGSELDPAADVMLALPRITPDSSLAAHPQVRRLADELAFGPDAALFINNQLLLEPLLGRIDTRLLGLPIGRLERWVESAERSNDEEQLAAARQRLAQAERERERLHAWRDLTITFLAPFGSSTAVGVDAAGGLELKAVMHVANAPRAWRAVTDLPREVRPMTRQGATLAVRVLPRLAGMLLTVLASDREHISIRSILAELGGAGVLDGVVRMSAWSRPGRSGARGALVRLGLRDADAVRARLAGLKRPGVRVDGRYLIMELPAAARRLALGARVRELADILAAAPGVGGVFAVDGAFASALFPPWGHKSAVRAVTYHVGVDGAVTDGDSVADWREWRDEWSRLVEGRNRRLARVRAELWSLLGAVVGAVEIRESAGREPLDREATVIVHAVQVASKDSVPRLAARAVQAWYEGSSYGPRGQRIAALEDKLAEIEDTISVGDRVNIEDLVGPVGTLSSSGSGSLVGGVGVGRGGGGKGWGTIGIGRIGRPGKARPGSLRVTASVTRAEHDPEHKPEHEPERKPERKPEHKPEHKIDRVLLDEALLRAVPRLRDCYRAHKKSHPRAAGYITVELRIAGGGIEVIDTQPAASAVELNSSELSACIATALRSLEISQSQTGTATATLWFGSE